jgi:uncharacterized membrane protein
MDDEETATRVSRSMRETLREAILRGAATLLPVAVTLIVLGALLDFIRRQLRSVAVLVIQIPGVNGLITEYDAISWVLFQLLVPVVLVVLMVVVGLVVSRSYYAERSVDYFDSFVTAIPAVGTIYESFRRMSDVIVDSDTQNFRDVKMVEFPHEGAYTLGFVTTRTPEPLRRPTGHEDMLTLFLPLAPNPVMGGHLVHLPSDRVMDVDLTVEEGLRAVVTSAVALRDPDDEVDLGRLAALADVDSIDDVDEPTDEGDPDGRN